MGNKKIKDSEAPNSYYSLYNNNYLANCYKYLIRSKTVHFITSLIETLLNIGQELFIFYRGYNLDNNNSNTFIKIILFFPENIERLSMIIKILIVIIYITLFDLLYYFLGKFKYKKEGIYILILYNIFELIYFRISMLLFLNIFFCLTYIYFFILLVLLFLHLYITSHHFLYNHLYIFVPIFVEYPYDEFSSLFDIFSLVLKVLLAIIGNSKNISVIKCLYIIMVIFQIFCCIYFIYHLIYHSYLFMKNLFLNKTKIALFFFQTFSLIIAELIGRNGIGNISFLIILISLFIITSLYVILIYDPNKYISIKRETPDENMFFYLFILSNNLEPLYIIEGKINIHYESCRICNLCKKYKKYLNQINANIEVDEKENANFIHKEANKNNDNIINILFDILYDGKNKYFPIIKEMILAYKHKKLNTLDNISFFYINLSFMIFSELKNNNFILALNIKIILEVINNTNKLQDSHEIQIKQITLCNEFLSLVRSTLDQMNAILKSEENQANKFLNLSISLNEMKKNKYRETLFNHKHDTVSNSKNIIYVCSLLYEEIFNTILNINKVPLRENYQILGDNFINTDKMERIISLALNLTNNKCKIVRAGRDLYCYRDNNLFDLIPLIFKDYLQKVFISKVLEHFSSNIKEHKENKIEINYNKNLNNSVNNNANRSKSNSNTDIKLETKINKRISIRRESAPKTIVKTDYIEFKMIISENISSRIFYKLLIMRLTPLFNNDYNSCFILLDGSFKLYKNTVMTLQYNKNQNEIEQRIISVSKPELEFPSEIYTMRFQKYIITIEKKNYKIAKIMELSLSKKIISIYSIIPKEREVNKNLGRSSFFINETIKLDFNADNLKKMHEKKASKKLEIFLDDTASVQSQKSLNNNLNYGSGLNIKIKKKENIYRNSNLYTIGNIIYLMIPVIILFVTIEIIHLIHLDKGDEKNDYSLVFFNQFYKLYFQLFSNILSIACIKYNSSCVNAMSLYSQQAGGLYDTFNCSLYIYGQNQILLKTLLERKNNLIDIHQNIGRDKYKEIFEHEVSYIRISKNFSNGKIDLNLMEVNMIFTEAFLISINSFKILANNTLNDYIYILNKKKDPFLYFDNYGNNTKNLSDFQKELYEMILNYKIFWTQFRSIYYELIEELKYQTKNIKFFIYFYFNASYFLMVIIITLLFIYMYNFEKLIVKIMNYVNMIINNKDDHFNFYNEFSNKIQNLDIIIKIYTDDPIKAVHDLTTSYNKYDKYISSKKKSLYLDMNKRHKKGFERKFTDDIFTKVPKHLELIKKGDISKLYIMFHYYILSIFICICIIFSYIELYLLWETYYLVKENLYSLLRKDTELEISFFKAMNVYNLMIFDNCTLDDLAEEVFFEPNNNINTGLQLYNSFYDDFYLSFYEKEIQILVAKFPNFPYFFYSCENLYFMKSDFMQELETIPEIQRIGNATSKIQRICELSNTDIFNDISHVFSIHYQTVRHAINLIRDFSYEGLVNHLKEHYFGEIFIRFNLILMYITDIINVKLHKIEYDNILAILSMDLIITIVVTIALYIILMFIVIFFYISRLKQFYTQIILLKQVFQICEVHEQ